MNREKIIAAARALFASRGPGVPFDTIAREAGVGNATVYRHFPTMEAVHIAIQEASLRETEEFLDELEAESDPWERIVALFRWVAHQPDVTLIDTILTPDLYDDAVGRRSRALDERAMRLIREAQEARLVREISPSDLDVLFLAVARIATEPKVTPEGVRRFIDILLDGLRPARTLSGE